uniref:Uncharacterized protein n=1 Tax=Percolomonas cosmopolitus TaxID=63605 RepID=A0A7S1KSD8_9EUKA
MSHTPSFYSREGIAAILCHSFRRKDLYWKCERNHENDSFSENIGNCYNGIFRFRDVYSNQLGTPKWFILPGYEGSAQPNQPNHFFLLLEYPSEEIVLYPSFDSFNVVLTLDAPNNDVQVSYFYNIIHQLKGFLGVTADEIISWNRKQDPILQHSFVNNKIAFSFQKKTWSIDYADKLDMDNVTPKAWIPNSTTWSLRGSIGIAELEQELCDQIDLNIHHFLQKKEGQRRGERS